MARIYGPAGYHSDTEHDRSSLGGWTLDWSRRPNLYKEYIDQPRRVHALTRTLTFPDTPLKETLNSGWKPTPETSLGEEDLARILYLGGGVTTERKIQGEIYHFRSAASAGALYPIEIYVAIPPGMQGVSPGLYHYHPGRHELSFLRDGWTPPRSSVRGLSDEGLVPVLFLSAIFHRSVWKYRERAYRYVLLDCGHVLENLVQSLRADGVGSQVHLDFDDAQVNAYLGLQEGEEACLAVLSVKAAISASPAQVGEDDDALLPRHVQEEGLSEKSAIRRMHAASCEIRRQDCRKQKVLLPSDLGFSLKGATPLERWDDPDSLSTTQSISMRRSRRNFTGVPLERGDADILLDCMAQLSKEEHPCSMSRVLLWGVLARNVNGMANGVHIFDPAGGGLGMVSMGEVQKAMAEACLEQAWLGRANLHFIFLSDLGLLQERFGPRGYRYAMIQAGMAGQRAYLASTSLGLGACGIGAFFDREVDDLLSLSGSTHLLYLLAAGRIRTKET